MRRTGAALVAVVLVLGGCTEDSSAPAPAQQPGLLVSSADDAGIRLQEREPGDGASGEEIVVDADRPGQTWDGVGAALTDDAVDQLTGRPDLVELLVGPDVEDGARLDWLRLPLTATDHSSTDWAWERTEAGVSPSAEAQRALDLLRDDVLPVAPDLRLVATPWTAPPELKEPAQWHGGALRDDAVPAYADLLVGQARWLVDAGYPLAALTLANEPGLARDDYPTMLVSDEQLAELARLVGPALHELGVELWALDHNWSDRSRVDVALATAAYDAVAFHCYEGAPEQAAGLPVPWLVTECTGTTDDARGTVDWDLDVLVARAIEAGSTGLLMWNAVLSRGSVGRPGGCTDCRGLLTTDGGADPIREPEFLVLAHLARAASPGDRVVAVSGPDDLSLVAFRGAGGAVTVLGYHRGDTPRDLRFRVGEGAASSYRIGPRELFTWTGAVA